jgi:hypothetical protein
MKKIKKIFFTKKKKKKKKKKKNQKKKKKKKKKKQREFRKKSLSFLFNHKRLLQKLKEKYINSITLKHPFIGFNSSIKIF